MPKHYIVGVDHLTKDQEEFFRGFVKKYAGTWWHWISGMWLLRFPEESAITPMKIWEFLYSQSPNAKIFITQSEGDNWLVSDYTASNGVKMDQWLKKHWSEEQ